MKSDIRLLKKMLIKYNVTIGKTINNYCGVPEIKIVTNYMPGKKLEFKAKGRAWQRKDNIYDLGGKFIIKQQDCGKTGKILKPLKEIENEVSVWANNEDVPIVDKVAILIPSYTKDFVFIVERKCEPYDNAKWQKRGWKRHAVKMRKYLLERYNINDVSLKNFVYSKIHDEIQLIDICKIKVKEEKK